MAERIATREAYGAALAEFGDIYDIVVLDAILQRQLKPECLKRSFQTVFLTVVLLRGI